MSESPRSRRRIGLSTSQLTAELDGTYGVARRRFAAGWYYTYGAATSDGSGALTANTMYAGAFAVDKSATFDRVTLECVVTVASANVRAGIYADNGSGLPGALVAELATLDMHTATGVISATIAQSLDPGLYWLASVAQGGAANVRTKTIVGTQVPQADGGNANVTGFSVTGVSGALPATFGTPSTVQIGLPKVMLRAA